VRLFYQKWYLFYYYIPQTRRATNQAAALCGRRHAQPPTWALGCMTEAEARADPHHISAYKLGRQIGSGAFGQVYLGTHHRTGHKVAIKLEPLSAAHPQLPHEARLYKSLSGEGVCQMYWHGTTEDGQHYALILELLGPSAEELLHKCRSTFSIATVSQLAITLLDRFEFIHSRGIVHRDVKPQNLAAPRSMLEMTSWWQPPLGASWEPPLF
jgi:serine/threonine protein kinase